MKFLRIASMATALVLSTSVNAAIISVDLQATGDHLITRDTTSGVDWLDLSVTDGMSVSAALSSYSADGFRWATNEDISGLFNAFSMPVINTTPVLNELVSLGIDINTGNIFQSYFGSTVNSTTGHASGYYQNPNDSVGSETYACIGDGCLNEGFVRQWEHSYSLTGHSSIGVFLVRDVSAVPVPAAVWLFGSGLIGLVGFARRKKA